MPISPKSAQRLTSALNCSEGPVLRTTTGPSRHLPTAVTTPVDFEKSTYTPFRAAFDFGDVDLGHLHHGVEGSFGGVAIGVG